MKISYLGPEGTYCYGACNLYTQGKDYTKIKAKTITDAIQMLVDDEVDECIVPIENSIRGTVLETVDALLENKNLSAKKEIILNIGHCLLSNHKCKKEDIKEIYSHPQALGQCKNYIKNNLARCKLNEVESTAKGAEIIKEKNNCACIANKICAEYYDLKIVDENIQDKNNNQTRFFVLSKKIKNKKENKKISLIFSTENNPGALYKILGLFNIFDVNMSKIESRPAQTGLGEYWFWVDIEGNIEDEKIKTLLDITKKRCSYFRIIGMY